MGSRKRTTPTLLSLINPGKQGFHELERKTIFAGVIESFHD